MRKDRKKKKVILKLHVVQYPSLPSFKDYISVGDGNIPSLINVFSKGEQGIPHGSNNTIQGNLSSCSFINSNVVSYGLRGLD